MFGELTWAQVSPHLLDDGQVGKPHLLEALQNKQARNEGGLRQFDAGREAKRTFWKHCAPVPKQNTQFELAS